MRTLVMLVGLLGVGAVGTSLVVGADPPAPAVPAPAVALPVTRWEYKVVGASELARTGGLLAALNKLGADGWELAAAVAPMQLAPAPMGFGGSGGFGSNNYVPALSGPPVYAGPDVPDPGPAWAAASRGRATVDLRDAEHADLRKRLGVSLAPPAAPLPPGSLLALSPLTREQFADLWNRSHLAAGPSVPADTAYHFKRPKR